MFGLFKKSQSEKLTLGIGEEETWQWRDHKIVYTVLGEGAPVVLQHGIAAAVWGFDFRHNIEPLATQYRVYVPDLPGFGRSERKAMRYTAEMYIEFQRDFAHFVAEREGQVPAVIANSLSAAHLIGAVSREPQSFGPLLLTVPTGLQRLDFAPTKGSTRVNKVLRSPVGSVVFRLLTTRASTRLFLKRDGYYDPDYIDDTMIEGYRKSGRRPNAKYAPVSFITFFLNHSVTQEWPTIKQPVLIVWGREAMITPLSDYERFIETRPQTELTIMEKCRLAVYDEQATEFNRLALDWLARHHQPVEAERLEVA